MKLTLVAAFQVVRQSRIPPALWTLIVLSSFPFVAFLAAGDTSGITSFIFEHVAAYLIAAIVVFAVFYWTYWSLCRALIHAKKDQPGTFGGWFFWVFIAGLASEIGAAIISFVVGNLIESDGYWIEASVRILLNTAALPLVIHAVRRASRLAFVPLQDTLEQGASLFPELQFTYMIFTAVLFSASQAAFLMIDYLSSLPLAIILTGAAGLLNLAMFIGQAAIAALGYHQIESRIAEQLPSTPSLM